MKAIAALLTPLAALLLGLVAAPAGAESADRKQPVHIEADRLQVDDRNKTQVFEGEVVLIQGSLVIRGDRLVVTQDAAGFQNGVATSTGARLATFRQKREGVDQYVEGEAERIEYNSRTEKARLFNRARVVSGGDEVRGHFIEYDAISEQYQVTNAPGGAAGSPDGRVRAVIQPKNDTP
jgi:lipopolysaccharide export system protein LptA